MNFIETLKSLNGVKPCPECDKGWYPVPDDTGRPGHARCQYCHGTGSILDLAPLLAKPKELEGLTKALVDPLIQVEVLNKSPQYAWVGQESHPFTNRLAPGSTPFKNLHVVSPARCATLGYETARQLGGTAVVAEPWYDSSCKNSTGPDEWTLSLPIPDNATVLFVTDRFNADEVRQMMESVDGKPEAGKKLKDLPYVLSLISHTDKMLWLGQENPAKIISLHQEKPGPQCRLS